MARLFLLIAVVLASAMVLVQCGGGSPDGEGAAAPGATLSAGAGGDVLARAFDEHVSDLEVEGEGVVVRLLADDDQGARHQRFILRLDSGQTLLVAHNIDVAPRVPDLQVGDVVGFRGVYEWSALGGTVHWTHRDPGGGHAAGWLRHDGHTYQ